MGQVDIQTKEYMSDPARFADAVNYAVYGGRQVVRKKELRPMDSTAVALPRGAKGTTGIQRHRDGLKLWQAMRDDHSIYAVLGIENQMGIHYAMPVRNMLYDAMSYAEQVSEAKSVRTTKARGGDEFLSGYGKDEKLMPVVTLVIHFGTKQWDGPMSLRDMLGVHDEELLELVPDYRINLIEPSKMTDTDFDKFHTELGPVLGYIKHAGNKDELERYVEKDERFKSMDAQSADLINAVTDSELKLEPGEEKVDMCQAIKDMRAESYESGRADERRSMSKAIRDMRAEMSKAIKDMRAESYESGRADERFSLLKELVTDGVLTMGEAAARAGMDVEALQAEIERIE